MRSFHSGLRDHCDGTAKHPRPLIVRLIRHIAKALSAKCRSLVMKIALMIDGHSSSVLVRQSVLPISPIGDGGAI